MNLHFCHVLVCFCQLHSRRDVVFKRRPHEPYGIQLGAKRDKTKIWLRKSYYIKRHNNSHLDASVKQVGWQKLPRSPLGAQEQPGGGGGFGENGNHSLTCLEGPLQYRDSVAWVWCRLIQYCSRRRTNWLNLTNTVKDGQAFNKMSKNWDFLGHKKDPKMLTEIIITFYLSKIVFVYLYQKLWNSIIHKIFCRRATTNLVWFRPTHQFQLAPWKKKPGNLPNTPGKKTQNKNNMHYFFNISGRTTRYSFFLQPLFLGWEWLVLNCSGMDQTT